MELRPLSLLFVLLALLPFSDAGSIGVNYGRVADNLPSANKVVKLLKSQGIGKIKVYDTDPAVLHALANSGIKVTVAVPDALLFAAARSQSFANSW
ncbi:hypothetical protein CRG98_025239, partial [Punica granatum]